MLARENEFISSLFATSCRVAGKTIYCSRRPDDPGRKGTASAASMAMRTHPFCFRCQKLTRDSG